MTGESFNIKDKTIFDFASKEELAELFGNAFTREDYLGETTPYLAAQHIGSYFEEKGDQEKANLAFAFADSLPQAV